MIANGQMAGYCDSEDLGLSHTVNVSQRGWEQSLRLTPAVLKDDLYGLSTVQFLASYAQKIWYGTQNKEMDNVTLATPTRGIVNYHKANTSRGQLYAQFEVSSCRDILGV